MPTERLSLVLLLIGLMAAADAEAVDPIDRFSRPTAHPNQFLPAYGHASQNPGSPRWFAPGYGYVVPGFGVRPASSVDLSNAGTAGAAYGLSYPVPTASTGLLGSHYDPVYDFGSRRSGLGYSAAHPFSSYSYGGPWFYPGSSTNLRLGTTVSGW